MSSAAAEGPLSVTAPSSRVLRSVRRGSLYAAAGLALGTYLGLNQLIGLHDVRPDLETWKPFVWELSSVLVIVALLPLVVRAEHRFRIDARPRARTLAVHLCFAVLFSIAHTSGMVGLRVLAYALAGQHYEFNDPLVRAFYELQKDLITYATVLVVIFAYRQWRVRRAADARSRELAAEVSAARLEHLTAQIEPHFLFNTLNAISNRMHEDVEAADRMISQLCTLLRAACDGDGSVLVPLAHELKWLDAYASMMTERYRGQLSFVLDVGPGLEQARLPRLLLQPLVENALAHGLADGRGALRVEVRRDGERLCCRVSDDGVGLAQGEWRRGTGLTNVARRLEFLYPGRHVLSIGPNAPRGTVVTAEFPAGA